MPTCFACKDAGRKGHRCVQNTQKGCKYHEWCKANLAVENDQPESIYIDKSGGRN